MTKKIIYRYLGTNGIIESPIHLEDTYYIHLIELKAEQGYLLTDGQKKRSIVRIPEEEVSNWYEVIDD